jgi:hypothetical protein
MVTTDLICKEINNLATIARGATMIPVEETNATEQPSQQLAEVAEEGLSVTVDASPVESLKRSPEVQKTKKKK